MATSQNLFDRSSTADFLVGKDFNDIMKLLTANGYICAKRIRNSKQMTLTTIWSKGRHEDYCAFDIVCSMKNGSYGMSVPGTIISSEFRVISADNI